MRYLSLICKNALRNKRRSLLTISSLAMSLCLLGVLMAVYFALYYGQANPGQARRMVSRHKVSLVFPMPQYYREKIGSIPGVQAVVTSNWFQGKYKNEQQDRSLFFPRFGADVDRLFDVYIDYKLADEQKQAFLKDRTGCIVSAHLAKRMNFQLGDKVTIVGDIYNFTIDLTVRGIYSSEDDIDNLYFNNKIIEEWIKARSPSRNIAGIFTTLVTTPADVPRIAKVIDETFANSDIPTRTESEQAFGLSFLAFIGNLKLILLSICGAVTFTIILVAANTMAMSIRERTREIGVMKTLGFTPQALLGMVLGESALISLLGGFIGLLLAMVLCTGLRAVAGSAISQLGQLSLQPPVLGLLLVVAVVIGVVSSIVPAWSASRMPILDALKFTD